MSKEPDYISISPEKAKELLQSGKAKPTKGNNLVDVPSLVFSLSVFFLMVLSSAIYFEYFSDTRIIKDFQPKTITFSDYSPYLSNTESLSEWVDSGNYQSIDSSISPLLYNSNIPEDLVKELWLYAIELRLAMHQYSQAFELAQVVQSNYTEDSKILASVLWYKAHVYYYQKRFLDSHQQFATVAIMNDTRYSEQAKVYQDEIYQLIRKDGINAIFD